MGLDDLIKGVDKGSFFLFFFCPSTFCHVKTQHSSPLQNAVFKAPDWKWGAALTRCQHLDLRLPSLQTVRNKFLFL